MESCVTVTLRGVVYWLLPLLKTRNTAPWLVISTSSPTMCSQIMERISNKVSFSQVFRYELNVRSSFIPALFQKPMGQTATMFMFTSVSSGGVESPAHDASNTVSCCLTSRKPCHQKAGERSTTWLATDPYNLVKG